MSSGVPQYMPCPWRDYLPDCFAAYKGKCLCLMGACRDAEGNCKFYKPHEQYRQELQAAEERALKKLGTGGRTYATIKRGGNDDQSADG